MPTPQERVAAAMRFFFETALPQAAGRTFAQLTSPLVHLGAYVRHSGGAITTAVGESLTPSYALRVGAALPVANGQPNAAGAAAPAADGAARHLVWLRHVADVATDNEEEIRRVMADADSFAAFTQPPAAAGAAGAPGAAPPAGGAGAPPAQPAPPAPAAALPSQSRAADWARGIAASSAALARNLSEITAVPAALQETADDLNDLKQVLQRFFTYKDDGTYYRRWAGAGRDAGNAQHLTAEYKQNNLQEIKLERENIYLYAVMPQSEMGAGELDPSVFREVVMRFDDTGVAERPFTIAALHTARWRRNVGAHADFVFFYAQEGLGIPIPRPDRDKLSARLIDFVASWVAAGPQAAQFLAQAPFVTQADGQNLVHLIATVEGPLTLPAGVVANGDAAVRVLLSPPERIVDLAAQPAVKHLGIVAPYQANTDLARGLVHHADLVAKIAAGKRGGKGVLVGVIDSGIDASHPAFAGRVVAFWDQGTPPAVPPGNNPAQNHAGNAAYTAFNFGVELRGPAAAGALDPGGVGHGTHVSGIAAGAEVRDGAGNVQVPAGLAPEAQLAVVRAIEVGNRANVILGAQWIFQVAQELGVPCVINMSFGHHAHAHDGSDTMARAMLNVVRDPAGAYRPGRILVASAGNQRAVNMHLRRTVPKNAPNHLVGYVQLAGGLNQELIVIWIKDPTGTKPAAFPLDLYLFRKSQRRNTFVDVTRAVRLGSQAVVPAPGSAATTTAAGVFVNHRTRIQIASQVSNPINGDHTFFVVLDNPTPLPGMIGNQWGIMMVNGSNQDLDVHMWIPGAERSRSLFMEATNNDDHSFLVGSPADSAAAVSVASCTSRITWTDSGGTARNTPEPLVGELSSFSSPGPLRRSSVAPATFSGVTHEVNGVDVTAPGAILQSALSAQAATPQYLLAFAGLIANARSQMLQGTSMAAPVVTGLVANLLAEEPTLTLPQVLDRLKRASTIPATTQYQVPPGTPAGAKPLSVDWGYGLVNAGQLKP